MLEKHKHHHPTRDFDGITDNRASKIPWYFSALFFGLVIWGAAYMGYFLFSGWSSHAEFEENMGAYQSAHQPSSPGAVAKARAQGGPAEDSLATGAALFGKRCSACHGKDGKGGVGPDLTRATFTFGRDPESVAKTIRGGRPGGMPAFGHQLSADEIEALAAYVLSLE